MDYTVAVATTATIVAVVAAGITVVATGFVIFIAL